MKVITMTYKDVDLEWSMDDLEIFQNILEEVILAVNGGFVSRLDCSPRQARGFFVCISQEIQQSNKNYNTITLIWTEVLFLKQLLNEVCNGIGLSNFEEKIGVSRDEAKKLMDFISNIIDEMKSLKEIRRASYLPSHLRSRQKS